MNFINGIRAEALTWKILAAEIETINQLLARARSFEQVERNVCAFRHADKQDGNLSESHFVNKCNTKKSNASAF